ncbi:uncharacterized protein LOC117111755, partial [Anneissia japonica]|uniref:uncharacterized protein LOC117111755 n=1 Tax=Anneissia japonica TaxID=1529436 RepID=UPI001425A108
MGFKNTFAPSTTNVPERRCPADCDYVLTCEDRKKIDSRLKWAKNLSISEPAVCNIAYQKCRCAPGAEFDDEQNKAFSQLINALPSNTGLCVSLQEKYCRECRLDDGTVIKEGQTLTRNECEICKCMEFDYNDVVGQCRKQCSLTEEDCSKKGLFLYKPEGECCKCSKQETTESPINGTTKYPRCPADCDYVLTCEERKKIDSGLDWTNNLSIRKPAVCNVAYQQCRCAPGAQFDDEQNKAFSQLINALPSNTGLCVSLEEKYCRECRLDDGTVIK